jgi:hypothetical protein
MSAAEKAAAAAEQEVNQGFKPAAIDQVRKLSYFGRLSNKNCKQIVLERYMQANKIVVKCFFVFLWHYLADYMHCTHKTTGYL